MIVFVNGHQWDLEQMRGILTCCGPREQPLEHLPLDLMDALREAVDIARAYKALLDTRDYYNDTVDARLRALTGETKGGA